jgi:Uma2 family endonuclease
MPETNVLASEVATIGDAVKFPPGDLWSDEPPLESDFHRRQIELLIRLLEWHWQDRQDYYCTGNLTIYYSPNQKKSEYFRGPDFFVVLGTEKRDRRSWVVWQEDGKYPNVIIEILSDSTAQIDQTEKKQIYQDTFRTPDYFWFDPYTKDLKGFRLVGGHYEELAAQDGHLWSEQLQLFLGLHEGHLRFFTSTGELVQLPEEALPQQVAEAQQQLAVERQRAEQERQRAEQERQEREAAERQLAIMRDRLRAAGVDPDTIV